MQMDNTSQQLLVEKLLNWDLVQQRLNLYPSIADAFPLEMLQNRRNSPPYFCHYMAWRLGTFNSENLVERINTLLNHARSLPNWECEKSLRLSGDYADFWSLIWQLQVAEYLSEQGTDVSWQSGGPDLSAKINGEQIYVECYTYRKSFGRQIFIEEICQLLADDLKVWRNLNSPFSITEAELDQLLRPLLNDDQLASSRCSAKAKHPEVLSQSKDGKLFIYVQGPSNTYDPTVFENAAGYPSFYLDVAIREAVKAKECANNLGSFRPNLLAVNYLLSSDFQLSSSMTTDNEQITPQSTVNIDAVAYAALGIDEKLTRKKFRLLTVNPDTHPAHHIAS